MGMIFQNANLVERLTVVQNVLHGRLGYMSTIKGAFGGYSEEDKVKALELLDDVGLLVIRVFASILRNVPGLAWAFILVIACGGCGDSCLCGRMRIGAVLEPHEEEGEK